MGRKFSANHRIDLVLSEITSKIKTWLQLVDNTPLSGPMKAWIVNHYVCAKLAWPLLIYDFPVTQARTWQSLIQPFYRRWVGLSANSEASVLYRFHEHFGLNFKHLGDMLSRLQVVRWHIMKYSSDSNARNLYQYRLKQDRARHYGKGRKSSPCLDLESLESDAKVQQIVGKAQRGRQGLGFGKSQRVLHNPNHEKRRQLGIIMRRDAENKRLALLHSYEMQNSWMTWGLSDMMSKDLTWNKILTGYSEKLLKFVLNSNLLTLATPDNLRRWNIATDVPCGLCTRPNVGLSHILAGCPWVLTVENKLDREDRNTWRHNCVLLHLATCIQRRVNEVNAQPLGETLPLRKPVIFVPAGSIPKSTKSPPHYDFGLLSGARDWSCDFDLPEFRHGAPYSFPQDVDATDIRCDGFIISRSKRILIIVELTVPMEDNIEHWHAVKTEKHVKALSHLRDWKIFYVILEVGCRGWTPPRFPGLLRKLGFRGTEPRIISDNVQLLARKCSYVIWLNRFHKEFQHGRIVVSEGSIFPPKTTSFNIISTGAGPSRRQSACCSGTTPLHPVRVELPCSLKIAQGQGAIAVRRFSVFPLLLRLLVRTLLRLRSLAQIQLCLSLCL